MERLSSLTLLPLTHLMVSTSNFPLTRARLPKKTKTREVFSAKVAKKVAITTLLQQVQMTILSKRMWKISLKSSVTSAIGRGIIQTSIPKIQKGSQKTTVSLGKLNINDWN